MKMRQFILFLAVAVFAAGLALPVLASNYKKPPPLPVQTSPRDLHLLDVGKVEEVIKSDTLRIGKNQKIYKIDNVRIPLQMNMAARDYLEENLLGKTVGVYINTTDANARKNELGHIYAHILTQDGKWVQADLISRGFAYATSDENSRDLVRALYKYEELGRARKLGLWQYPNNDIKNDATIGKYINTFNIYEGVITDVRDNRKFIFLNFGKDIEKNVTAVIKMADQLIFVPDNTITTFKYHDLKGRHVRIRGWFEEKDGPMLMITHPEQIEFPGVHGALPVP